jgi:predicted hydrocarbon binding protein
VEQLHPRFNEMLNQVEIDADGKLTLMGVRSVITPVGSLVGIMEASDDIMGPRGTWIITYRAGYSTAMDFARTMMEVHSFDANQVALAYSDFAHLRGWGFYRLVELEFANGHGRLHVHHSIFADHFLEQGISNHPVCGFIAGALAGVASAVSGVRVRAKELQCAAMGADFCELVVDPY